MGDCESKLPEEKICLTEDQCLEPGAVLPVRFVKFQNVNNITLFIPANLGNNDVTKLRSVQFFGFPAMASDISKWEKPKS